MWHLPLFNDKRFLDLHLSHSGFNGQDQMDHKCIKFMVSVYIFVGKVFRYQDIDVFLWTSIQVLRTGDH